MWCEYSTEEQTVDHVILHCPTPIHQPPHEAHDLAILDDKTIKWLINISPKIECDLAVD